VLIGRGSDPDLMERLSLAGARAVAAVTSNDLENIAVAMAARSAHPDIRVVMRVGNGEIANDTRSLLPLGLVRDVHLRFADGRIEATGIDTRADSETLSATDRPRSPRRPASRRRSCRSRGAQRRILRGWIAAARRVKPSPPD